jgi:hypothetical protein
MAIYLRLTRKTTITTAAVTAITPPTTSMTIPAVVTAPVPDSTGDAEIRPPTELDTPSNLPFDSSLGSHVVVTYYTYIYYKKGR